MTNSENCASPKKVDLTNKTIGEEYDHPIMCWTCGEEMDRQGWIRNHHGRTVHCLACRNTYYWEPSWEYGEGG